MYGTSAVSAINAGVPASVVVLTAAGQSSLLSGVVLAGGGLMSLALLLRSRRLCVRDFESGGPVDKRAIGTRHRPRHHR